MNQWPDLELLVSLGWTLAIHSVATRDPYHWVGYQIPEPFVWLVLIGQVPDTVEQEIFMTLGADFRNLLKSKQAKQKVLDFGIPPSATVSETIIRTAGYGSFLSEWVSDIKPKCIDPVLICSRRCASNSKATLSVV